MPLFPTTYEFWLTVLEKLRELEPLVRVFGDTPADSTVRSGGYVIVDGDPGYPIRGRGCGGTSEHAYRVQLRVCGFSPSQALHTCDLVRAHLEGYRPWPHPRWTPLVEVDSGPVIQDDSEISDVRYSITLTYLLEG